MASAGWDGRSELLGGRYALGDVLGAGSSAVVYRAVDVRGGHPVAVKLFEPSSSPGDDRRRRRELDALTRLDHPGLVRLLDGDPTARRPYLVMELVEGRSLAEALADGPLPADHVAVAGAELATALAVVHAAGLVHRDVKPANVLLDGAGRPRLTDFGVARALDAGTATTAGVVTGTAAYMAPEQVRGRPVEPAADVYSLGLVLLEAVTGRREYPGPVVESALARLSRPPGIPAGLPAPLAAALFAMTATDPGARPSAERCATLLAGATSASAPTQRLVGPAARRRTSMLLAGTAAGALVLTGAGIALSGAASPPVASSAVDRPVTAPAGSAPDTAAADPSAPTAGAAAVVAVVPPADDPTTSAAGDPDGGGAADQDDSGGDGGVGSGDYSGDSGGGGTDDGGSDDGGSDDGGGDSGSGGGGGGTDSAESDADDSGSDGKGADQGTGGGERERPGRSGEAPGHASDD